MKLVTEEEKKRLWEEAERDFPDDEMMRDIHYVRLLHQRQTKGMSVRERMEFYNAPKTNSQHNRDSS